MADELKTKKITDLEENTTIDDTDILMAGDKGTNALKRFTVAKLFDAIKTKIAGWAFDTLTTTDKTLPGAVNELNSKMSSKDDIFAMDWLSINDNPKNLAIGLHGIGTLDGNGRLTLKGEFINDSYNDSDYDTIMSGISISTINEKFGTHFSVANELKGHWKLIPSDNNRHIDLYGKGTAFQNMNGVIAFARIFTENGNTGGWGAGSLIPGYIEIEVWLQ